VSRWRRHRLHHDPVIADLDAAQACDMLDVDKQGWIGGAKNSSPAATSARRQAQRRQHRPPSRLTASSMVVGTL